MSLREKFDLKVVLTIGSIVGLVGTGIAAAYGGKKQKELELEKKEKLEAKEVAKCYIPAIGVGALTGFCIVKSHTMSAAEIATLTAGTAYLAKNRDYLEQKLTDVVGDEKMKEFKDKFTAKQLSEAPKKGILKKKIVAEETGNGDVLFYIPYSGRLFRSSLDAVTNAINDFIEDRGDVDNDPVNPLFLFDLYERLGVRPDDFSKSVFWGDENDGFDRDIYINIEKFNPKEDPTYGLEDVNEDIYLLDIPQYYYPMYDPYSYL